jgi:FAD/FMN-containing dehydrogenase
MSTMQSAAASTVETLAEQVAGPVIARGDRRRDQELAGFNLAVAHDPDLVVGAVGAADVSAAVGWARERGMPVGVLSTGHGWQAPMTGGLMITTRRMQELTLDAATGRLRVGAGVTWRTVLDAATTSGWAAPCGSASGVGVVGYTLGGGLPVLGRAFGLAADRVTALDVVTADRHGPSARRVTAATDPDLFWALRGGGSAFGVVTALEMTLPHLPTFYGGGLFFPGEHAADVVRAWVAWTRDLPDAMSSSLALLRTPPMPEVPEPLRGRFVVHARIAYAGDARSAERWLAPLRSLAVPVVLDTVADHPYSALDLVHQDPDRPVPARDAGVLLEALPEAAVDRLLDLAGPASTSPLLLVELRHLGGALTRGTDSAARGSLDGSPPADYSLHTVGMMVPPVAELVPGAIDAVLDGLAPWATGRTLLNLQGRSGGGAGDPRRPWPPTVVDRLAGVKAVVDPTDTFRVGHPDLRIGTTADVRRSAR